MDSSVAPAPPIMMCKIHPKPTVKKAEPAQADNFQLLEIPELGIESVSWFLGF